MADIGEKIKKHTVYKALAAAGNYDAEDVLSDSATAGTIWKLQDVVDGSGNSGIIHQVQALCSTTGLEPRITLYMFDLEPTDAQLNDNVANTAVTTLHASNALCPPINLCPMSDLGGNSESWATPSTSGNLPVCFQCLNCSRDIYFIAVTEDAETGEAAGMTLRFNFWIEEY